jgi:hypothetical protein
MLEQLRIESFALVAEGEEFVVRDKTPGRKQLTPREKALFARLQERHNRAVEREGALQMATGVLEWRLTREDISGLEQEGRAQRRGRNLTPDGHATSQVLRVVGDLVDHNKGRLLSVVKEENKVTVEYEVSPERRVSEELTLPMLYDAWVRMFKARARNNE